MDADSNDYWEQSSVTVKSTAALTSLKVVVPIIQTRGVQHTGFWSSLGDKVNVAQAANSSELDYVVTLKPGVTLDPAEVCGGMRKGPYDRSRTGPFRSSAQAVLPGQAQDHFVILVTWPAPTVRPPSRMANFRPSSMATGWMSSTFISVLSPGMTISVPSGRVTTPVTSVVRK